MKTALVALLCVLALIAQPAFAETADSDVTTPKVEYRGGIYYLVLDAEEPYERGLQHGRALKLPIQLALRNFKDWLRVNAHAEDPERMIRDFATGTGYMEAVRTGAPDLHDEMRGIAAGADVELRELFVYQSFDELFLYLMKSGALEQGTGHCTTTAVYGRDTLPNIITHNNDIPTYHEAVGTVLRIRYPDSDLEILQATFAGQIGQNGVNNRGVAVGINTIADLPVAQSGIPVSFHVRRILESGDRHAAVAYLETQEFGTAMNYMIADREGVVSAETWADNVAVLDHFPAGIAAHTNHSLQRDAPVVFKMDPSSGGGSYGFTHERLELALDTLSEDPSALTVMDVRRLQATRPILVNPGSPSGRTLMAMMAAVPKTGSPILYNTPDSPNWFETVEFRFD